jgi:hypothetical protein
MSAAPSTSLPAAPRWLVTLTLTSVILAMMALGALLWAKWGVVVAMAQDIYKACF